HRQHRAGAAEPDVPGVDPVQYAELRTQYRRTGKREGRGESSVIMGQASVPAIQKAPARQAETPAPLPPGVSGAARDGLRISRRRLPHWRMDGATYFVTWRLRSSQRELSESERSLVVDALRHFDGERYDLIGYVVMNDHVHLVVRPYEGCELSGLLHTWKSYTANRMQRETGRVGAVWQDESFDRIVRDEDEYFEKLGYILTNPQRRWPGIQEYAWVGVCDSGAGLRACRGTC
ncbi:MAG: hypothetical protein D6693_08315, partial [Planctomycetota bacterium]